METVNYFCAFGPFSWLSPFQKGSFVCCPCSVHGWHLAGLFFPGIGTSAHPHAGLCRHLGDRPALGLWADSGEIMVWKYRAGQQHLAQKEKGEERAQALLAKAGTQALKRLEGQGELPPIPSPTLKGAFLGGITIKWGCNSVWGNPPEVPHEVAWSQPSGRAYPWETGLHRQPREHSPGRARAVSMRFSLAWVREGIKCRVTVSSSPQPWCPPSPRKVSDAWGWGCCPAHCLGVHRSGLASHSALGFPNCWGSLPVPSSFPSLRRGVQKYRCRFKPLPVFGLLPSVHF